MMSAGVRSLSGASEAGGGVFVCTVEHAVAQGRYSRVLSVSTGISVAEFADAILASFRWPIRIAGVASVDNTTRDWAFRARRAGIVCSYGVAGHSIGTELSRALASGSLGELSIGGYSFTVTVAQSIAAALPVGGEVPEVTLLAADFLPGDPHPLGIPGELDSAAIAEVNVELAGSDGVEDTLSDLKPELAELLRGHPQAMLEFLPLLQALDLGGEVVVDPGVAETLADAPEETSARSRVAAWARIVALATLAPAAEVGRIAEDFAAAVGVPMSAEQIEEKSRRTRRILAMVGADEWQAQPDEVARPLVPKRSLVQRMEMYRYVLQR